MKVLAVSSYGGLGGAELNLATLLRSRPSGVDAVAVAIGSGGLPARLAALGIPTWAVPAHDGRPSLFELARFGRSFARLVGSEAPDRILAVGLKAAIYALAAQPFLSPPRPPIVWYKVDFSLESWLARPLAAAVDGVIAVSGAAAGSLGERLSKRRLLAVIPPAVGIAPEVEAHPDPATAPVIGALGTMLPIKGFEQLLRAFSRLSVAFPELRLEIGGGDSPAFPSYRDELGTLADELGISERVSLLGFVEPTSLLRHCTVYVSSTYSDGRYGFEGLSGAMLEASWVGLPVVATRGGGTPEGVIDGVTGMLVEPGDPRSLAEAIAALLRDPEHARAMGAAGRRFAQSRFAPSALAAELFAHLETMQA